MRIKVFIATYNRPESMKTHLLFQDSELWDMYFVVNNDEIKNKYIPFHPEQRFIVTNENTGAWGLTLNRAYVLENCVDDGDWCLFLGDNISKWNYIDNKFKSSLSEKEFHEELVRMIEKSEDFGYGLCGFSPVKNDLFALKMGKFSLGIYFIWGKAMVMKNTSYIRAKIRDIAIHSHVKEDYAITLEYALRSNGVMRNNFIFPNANMYTKGGIGSKESRKELNQEAIKWLKQEYGFIVRNNKKRDGEILISINKASYDKWRYTVLALYKEKRYT